MLEGLDLTRSVRPCVQMRHLDRRARDLDDVGTGSEAGARSARRSGKRVDGASGVRSDDGRRGISATQRELLARGRRKPILGRMAWCSDNIRVGPSAPEAVCPAQDGCYREWGWQASNLRPSDYESLPSRPLSGVQCRPRRSGSMCRPTGTVLSCRVGAGGMTMGMTTAATDGGMPYMSCDQASSRNRQILWIAGEGMITRRPW
jgi:hypothetical protein